MPKQIPTEIASSHPSFYKISPEEAHELLNNQPYGTYLFCCSSLNENENNPNFYVSYIVIGQKAPVNLLVEANAKGYIFWDTSEGIYDKGKSSYRSLKEFIEIYQKKMPVLKPYADFVAQEKNTSKQAPEYLPLEIVKRHDYANLTEVEARAVLKETTQPIGAYLFVDCPDSNRNNQDSYYLNLFIKVLPSKQESYDENEHEILTFQIYVKFGKLFNINNIPYESLDEILSVQAKELHVRCCIEPQPFFIDNKNKQSVLEKLKDDLYYRLLESVKDANPDCLGWFNVDNIIPVSAINSVDKANMILEAKDKLGIVYRGNQKLDFMTKVGMELKRINNPQASGYQHLHKLFGGAENTKPSPILQVQSTLYSPANERAPLLNKDNTDKSAHKSKRNCCF